MGDVRGFSQYYVEVNNGDEQFKMSTEEASALIDEKKTLVNLRIN